MENTQKKFDSTSNIRDVAAWALYVAQAQLIRELAKVKMESEVDFINAVRAIVGHYSTAKN